MPGMVKQSSTPPLDDDAQLRQSLSRYNPDDSVGYLVKQAHVLLQRAVDAEMTAIDLTAMQWRSLDTFNRLGASLPVDFSAGDLRSAFRLLARRYHPDRHPGATAPDRQRLAQQFTSLRTSYETLLTALESAAA